MARLDKTELVENHSNIKLWLGDCFDLMTEIPDNSVDLILTDPPYLFNRGHYNLNTGAGTTLSDCIGNRSELYRFGNKLMNDMWDFDKPKIYKLLDESERMLKIMRGYYFCNETALQYYLSWATEHNYKYNIIALEKPAFIMNRNKYAPNCEFMVRIIAKSGAGIKVLDYSYPVNKVSWLHSVQKFNVPQDKLHPTEKPQDILEGVVRLNTDEGDLVVDPFMGSGSLGAVCKHTKRNYIGIEIDEQYYDVAVNRIANSLRTYRLF